MNVSYSRKGRTSLLMFRSVWMISQWTTADQGARKLSGNLRGIKSYRIKVDSCPFANLLVLEIYFDLKTHKCLVSGYFMTLCW